MKPVLIIQNTPFESPGNVPAYLRERNISTQIVRSYVNDVFPEPDSVSAIINLGCPHSVTTYYQHDFLTKLYAYASGAVRANVPYLGICFGGQMLAKILGARVEANPVKEIGTYTVNLTEAGKSDPLFAGFPDTFPVFHWHGDTFRIPFDAAHLVSGEDCKNQAFRKGRLVALQFHLEALAEEVPSWCDVYADELAGFGAEKKNIIADYNLVADQVSKLGLRLLDNFFALTADSR